jgi:hypothetical protein
MTTYRSIALALLDAEESPSRFTKLREGLSEVNPDSLMELVTVMVATLAVRGEITPRTIYESLFASCPSDESWSEIIEGMG